MEKLKYKFNNLILANKAFERALSLYQSSYEDSSLAQKEAYVASVIKHFELFYETLHKCLKEYLRVFYQEEVIGSKTIFRACYRHNMINDQELKKLLEVVDIRNATTHMYSEETAKRVGDTIEKYYPVMNKIVDFIKIIE